jgi:hypothetical protein
MAYVKLKLKHSISIVNNIYLHIPFLTLGDSKLALQIKRRQVSGKSSLQYGGTCDRNILERGKEFSANNTVSPLLLRLPALVNGGYVNFYVMKASSSFMTCVVYTLI